MNVLKTYFPFLWIRALFIQPLQRDPGSFRDTVQFPNCFRRFFFKRKTNHLWAQLLSEQDSRRRFCVGAKRQIFISHIFVDVTVLIRLNPIMLFFPFSPFFSLSRLVSGRVFIYLLRASRSHAQSTARDILVLMWHASIENVKKNYSSFRGPQHLVLFG